MRKKKRDQIHRTQSEIEHQIQIGNENNISQEEAIHLAERLAATNSILDELILNEVKGPQ